MCVARAREMKMRAAAMTWRCAALVDSTSASRDRHSALTAGWRQHACVGSRTSSACNTAAAASGRSVRAERSVAAQKAASHALSTGMSTRWHAQKRLASSRHVGRGPAAPLSASRTTRQKSSTQKGGGRSYGNRNVSRTKVWVVCQPLPQSVSPSPSHSNAPASVRSCAELRTAHAARRRSWRAPRRRPARAAKAGRSANRAAGGAPPRGRPSRRRRRRTGR